MSKSKKRSIRQKMNKRKTNKRKTKTNKKNMSGGDYTEEQKQQLLDLGFTPFFIKIADGKIGINVLITNFNQSGLTAQQYMNQTYRSLNIDEDDGLTSESDSSPPSSQDSQNGGKKRNKRIRIRTRKNRRKNKSRK